MDSEEQAVPVLLNVLSDILLIKVNLSNNFFQCICTLLKLFDDVCLSTLTLVGPNGVQGKVPMRMTKAEIEQLKKSADALKEIIAQIDLN